ncbi:type IV secretion system protein [Kribbella sp. NPDC051770]|uniref:type IV secretion system protein n=1 Tax=Kribbella sp. NPDC051770 TaxID=3155413 RepID=UPI0034334ABE
MCSPVDVACGIKEGFATLVTNQFDILATKLGELAESGLTAVSTFWITNDEVQPAPIATHQGNTWTASDPVALLHNHTMALSITVFVIAVIIAGLRTAWEQRAEPLRDLLKATLTLVVVAGAGTAFIQVLIEISDGIALAVIKEAKLDAASDQAIGKALFQGISLSKATADLPLVATMFFAVAVFMASVVQVILLLIRSAMLVLLAGTFPLAAAATNTEVGKAWFRKYCGWVLAFVAYKPAAALVYAAAFKMTQSGIQQSGNTLVNALGGLMMMLLAVFALPALLRLVVPVTAAVAGGAAGSGSTLADPGGLATGAINAGRGALGARSTGGAHTGGAGGGGGGGTGGGALGATLGGARGGGAFKSAASGALGAGLTAGAAAMTSTKKAGGALSGAAAHSAGEPAGGTPTSGTGGAHGWSTRRPKPTPSSSPAPTPTPAGPTGSGH